TVWRMCGAKCGSMDLNEGRACRPVAVHNAPPALAEMRRRNPVFRPNPRIALARAAATKQTIQIADAQAEPGYLDPLPGFSGPQIVTLGDPIFRPGPASGLGRSIRLKQVVQVPDLVNDQACLAREPARVRGVEAG